MKKSKKLIALITVFLFIVILIVVDAFVYNSKLIDVQDRKSILNTIAFAESGKNSNSLYKSVSKNERHEDINSIEYDMAQKGDYSAIFYEYQGRNNIIVLKKSKIAQSKYEYFGSDSSSSSLGAYNYSEVTKNGTLFIAAISIRQMANYNDFKNTNEISITKINRATKEKTEDSVEGIDKVPYFNLIVKESPADDDSSYNCVLSANGEAVATYESL